MHRKSITQRRFLNNTETKEILELLAVTMDALDYKELASEIRGLINEDEKEIMHRLHLMSVMLRLVPLAKQVLEGKIDAEEFTVACHRQMGLM
jgi:hypothetical protein